jgi:hypothetical protein
MIKKAREKIESGEWIDRSDPSQGGRFPDRTQYGDLKPTLPNTKVALALLKVECRHDLFKLRYIIDGPEVGDFIIRGK